MSARAPWVLLANGRVALTLLKHRLKAGDKPMLVVLNAREKQRLGEDLRAAAQAADIETLEWSPSTEARLLDVAGATPGLWLLSIYFGHKVSQRHLDAVGGRALNLHPALLPWCRGVHTNVWPIVENTPAGVTLHVMTDRFDEGAVIAQRQVPVHATDTGATLYQSLEQAAEALITEVWPDEAIRAWPGKAQGGGGSRHTLKDFTQVETFDLDKHPEARRFFDMLRARTFPPFSGLTVIVDGERVEAKVTLTSDEKRS